MTTIKQLYKKRNELKRDIRDINIEIDEKLSNKYIKCESNNYGHGCGKGSKIKNITYIQTYWYEEPYGCTGGDTYHMGDGEYDCPKCGHRNRLYNRKEMKDLKYLFKNIIEDKNE